MKIHNPGLACFATSLLVIGTIGAASGLAAIAFGPYILEKGMPRDQGDAAGVIFISCIAIVIGSLLIRVSVDSTDRRSI